MPRPTHEQVKSALKSHPDTITALGVLRDEILARDAAESSGVPASLLFEPSNPDSRSCRVFSFHVTKWSDTTVPGNKHLASLESGKHIQTPCVFQLGRCTRCGVMIKREV